MTLMKPDWTKAPEWAQWWAVDEIGMAIWWEQEPSKSENENEWAEWFVSNDSRRFLDGFSKEIPYTNWRNSLTKRPD